MNKEQEKARELTSKFLHETNVYFPDNQISYKQAKHMAAICVREIILGYEFDSLVIEHERIMDKINYWDEVEKILNL
jgi:GTPase Era involved in 16S rRNA processing